MPASPAAAKPLADHAAAPAAAESFQHASVEIEVCGVGKVKVAAEDLRGGSDYVGNLTKESRLRRLEALRNSDDYRARAAGLFLENMFDTDAHDVPNARSELVQLAVGTQDPAVYALAYSKCNNTVGTPASADGCQRLSLDEWTRRDPDNAVPWLLIAAKAGQANDASAEGAAFAHAAAAHRYDPYTSSLMAFADSEKPDDVTPLDQWYFGIAVNGVEAATLGPVMPYLRYCSGDRVKDPIVHQHCAALAELLAAKGTTLIDLSVAAALGSRLGWAADRVSGLRQRFNAMLGMLEQAMPSDREITWSCATAARGNAYFAERERLGELGAVQELIEQSGESIPELARKHAKYLEDLRAGH